MSKVCSCRLVSAQRECAQHRGSEPERLNPERLAVEAVLDWQILRRIEAIKHVSHQAMFRHGASGIALLQIDIAETVFFYAAQQVENVILGLA